jgi:hypothetical protein
MLGGKRGHRPVHDLWVVPPGTLRVGPQLAVWAGGGCWVRQRFTGEMASCQDEDQRAIALGGIPPGGVIRQRQESKRAVFLGDVAAIGVGAQDDDLVRGARQGGQDGVSRRMLTRVLPQVFSGCFVETD